MNVYEDKYLREKVNRIIARQKEGEIIHVICDRITDHDAMLRQVGRSALSIAPGRGDGARNGSGPDSREPALRVRSHDFH